MTINNRQWTEIIQQSSGGVHVFYNFTEEESYLENVVSYIVSGIEQEDRIFVIENERLLFLLHNKLQSLFSHNQLEKVHFVNNFQYYVLNGDFDTPTILKHFSEIIEHYSEDKDCIRTWAHVEWGNQKDINQKIKQFEQIADKVVNEKGLVSVCAYDADRVPESLKTILMSCHKYSMTDDNLVLSNLYRKLENKGIHCSQ